MGTWIPCRTPINHIQLEQECIITSIVRLPRLTKGDKLTGQMLAGLEHTNGSTPSISLKVCILLSCPVRADNSAWEQMSVARAFNTTAIWILNVGTLKPLELPVEHYMSLAWDLDAWPVNSVDRFLKEWAAREFGEEVSDETADIMKKYSVRLLSHDWYGKLICRCMLPGEKRNWSDLIHSQFFNLTSTSTAKHKPPG
jgi:hypothetical protein